MKLIGALNEGAGLIGTLTNLLGGSPERQEQKRIRELDAKYNGFSSWEAWDKAGSPWTPKGILLNHLRDGVATAQDYINAGIPVGSIVDANGTVLSTTGSNVSTGNSLLNMGAGTPAATSKTSMADFFRKKWVKVSLWVLAGIGVIILCWVIIKKSGRKKYSYSRR